MKANSASIQQENSTFVSFAYTLLQAIKVVGLLLRYGFEGLWFVFVSFMKLLKGKIHESYRRRPTTVEMFFVPFTIVGMVWKGPFTVISGFVVYMTFIFCFGVVRALLFLKYNDSIADTDKDIYRKKVRGCKDGLIGYFYGTLVVVVIVILVDPIIPFILKKL